MRGKSCACDGVFRGFQWNDLKSLTLNNVPKLPGVYVLRLVDVNGLADRVRRAYEEGLELLRRASWRELWRYYGARLERLKRIDTSRCPVIYIGGTGRGGGTLRSRLYDLAGVRHTAFYPTFTLLLAGCDIDYGWMALPSGAEAFNYEEQVKREYVKVHGSLPPLNEK